MPKITSQPCSTSTIHLATFLSLFHVFLSIFSGLHLDPPKSTSIATLLPYPPELVLPPTFLIMPLKVVLAKLSFVMMRDGDAGFPVTTLQEPFSATISSNTFKKNVYSLAGGCYPAIRLARHPQNFIYPMMLSLCNNQTIYHRISIPSYTTPKTCQHPVHKCYSIPHPHPSYRHKRAHSKNISSSLTTPSHLYFRHPPYPEKKSPVSQMYNLAGF